MSQHFRNSVWKVVELLKNLAKRNSSPKNDNLLKMSPPPPPPIQIKQTFLLEKAIRAHIFTDNCWKLSVFKPFFVLPVGPALY